MSYAVSQRMHEFGVRVALGATWTRIVTEVLKSGLRTVIVGVVAGLRLALASGRLIASLMYGVSSSRSGGDDRCLSVVDSRRYARRDNPASHYIPTCEPRPNPIPLS